MHSTVKAAAAVFLGGILQPSITLADLVPAPWSSEVKYEVLQSAPAGSLQPKVGDLVAIRFKGSYKGSEFDNTFKTEFPYFYRHEHHFQALYRPL